MQPIDYKPKKQRKPYTWSESGLQRKSERMRKLNADPEFNPLAALAPQQREQYDVLVKKGGYKRQEALRMILGEGATA